MIHIYTGNGKGKTTAALGLAMRAAGRGLCPAVFFFLKNSDTGEAKMLATLSDVFSCCCQNQVQGFFWEMSTEEKLCLAQETKQGFFKAQSCAKNHKHHMIVLDEIGGCIENDLLSEQDVIAFLEAFSRQCEIVMTGRNFPEALLNMADYVSEIREVKHPMHRGIPPRLGIEF